MIDYSPESPATVAPLLERHPITSLRRLQVTENRDEVIISGLVNSYYLKQMAQETIRPSLGGRRLQNQVRVVA